MLVLRCTCFVAFVAFFSPFLLSLCVRVSSPFLCIDNGMFPCLQTLQQFLLQLVQALRYELNVGEVAKPVGMIYILHI